MKDRKINIFKWKIFDNDLNYFYKNVILFYAKLNGFEKNGFTKSACPSTWWLDSDSGNFGSLSFTSWTWTFNRTTFTSCGWWRFRTAKASSVTISADAFLDFDCNSSTSASRSRRDVVNKSPLKGSRWKMVDVDKYCGEEWPSGVIKRHCPISSIERLSLESLWILPIQLPMGHS